MDALTELGCASWPRTPAVQVVTSLSRSPSPQYLSIHFVFGIAFAAVIDVFLALVRVFAAVLASVLAFVFRFLHSPFVASASRVALRCCVCLCRCLRFRLRSPCAITAAIAVVLAYYCRRRRLRFRSRRCICLCFLELKPSVVASSVAVADRAPLGLSSGWCLLRTLFGHRQETLEYSATLTGYARSGLEGFGCGLPETRASSSSTDGKLWAGAIGWGLRGLVCGMCMASMGLRLPSHQKLIKFCFRHFDFVVALGGR